MKCEREREKERGSGRRVNRIRGTLCRSLQFSCFNLKVRVVHARGCSAVVFENREGEQRKADFPEEPLVNGRKCDTDSNQIVNGVAK